MADDFSLAEIVAPLFRAAAGIGPWDEALQPMASALHSHCHAVWLRSSVGSLVMEVAGNLSAAMMQEYQSHYASVDPLAPRGAARPRGTIFTSDELVPMVELERTEYFNDYMARHDLRRFIGSACALPDGDGFVAVAFQRPLDSEPFDARARDMMAAFMPQVRAAMEVWFHIRDVNQRARELESLLDASAGAMALVRPDGRVRLHNRAFAEILARGDAIALANGHHLEARGAGRAPLAAALRRASLERTAATITLTATSRRGAYRVIATPFADEARGIPSAQQMALVRVVDLSLRDGALAILLRGRYELTAAEADVVVQLARGRTLEAIAKARASSVATARNLVKRAFAKTDTHRQAELVAVVIALENEHA